MKFNHQLAIVIPAFKVEYFEQTLNSLCSQTCLNFSVYVGDDCSEHDLFKIVRSYSNSLDIKYKRFSNNLGQTDLVGHWRRCIDMVEKEQWILLFSDDDLLGPTCIDDFYITKSKFPDIKLFRYKCLRIDSHERVIKKDTYNDHNINAGRYFE